MTDMEMWKLGVAAVEREYAALSPLFLAGFRERTEAIKSCKNAIHAFAEAMNGREVCAVCQGECCVTGKHHFTVIDLLVYLASERQLFEPRFERGRCPYLGENGCLMEPEYRPFNCVTFNCERVQGPMASLEIERFHAMERELLAMYKELEELFDNRFMYGLLINCERDLLQGKTAILRTTT
ncbi:MAG: hypothetical protein FD174_3991 [Geobacteraceae bacterium]|nr:MAG: hypothetical protein FD174_3991 [Geobacteraceae bacterium]